MDGVATRLRLRVSPGAARSAIVGRHGEGWKVRVTAPAEGGKANEAVLRLVAAAASVPRRSVRVVSGHASRDKIIELDGVGQDETERRLTSAGKDDG